MKNKKNYSNFAILSFCFTLLSILMVIGDVVTSSLNIVSSSTLINTLVLFVILGLVFGIIGKVEIKRKSYGGNGMATVSIVLNLIAMILILFFLAILTNLK